jgi:hypothetical protein
MDVFPAFDQKVAVQWCCITGEFGEIITHCNANLSFNSIAAGFEDAFHQTASAPVMVEN